MITETTYLLGALAESTPPRDEWRTPMRDAVVELHRIQQRGGHPDDRTWATTALRRLTEVFLTPDDVGARFRTGPSVDELPEVCPTCNLPVPDPGQRREQEPGPRAGAAAENAP